MGTLADLSQYLRDLSGHLEPRRDDLQAALEHQVTRIKNRTAQGISVEGSPFPPAKTGGNALHKSGAMLDAITVESIDTEGRMFFADAEQEKKAAINNTGSKYVPQRHFFGVSDQDKEQIVADIKTSVMKRVNNG